MHVTLPDGVRVEVAECTAHPDQQESLADLAIAYDLRRRPHTLIMIAGAARLGEGSAGR